MKDNVMGERIRELRKEYNMSAQELGDKIGVKFSAVCKYERGDLKNIKISIISNIAKVFNVSPLYIMGMVNDRNYKSSKPNDDKPTTAYDVMRVLPELSDDELNSIIKVAKAMLRESK